MFLARLSFSTIAAALMSALPAAADPILVNSDNFVRAESDLYFSGIVANGGFGKFDHTREMAPLDKHGYSPEPGHSLFFCRVRS
ncbi:hypothetical protein CDO30_18580 (plasmid) [Sinorhizobium meliloti]|uniref:Uncharacterized protein n=1 Tax=Rhizobium meliloti (strain 1021) TaxID=266834 RepID=Q92ZB4_RHIME|nr:hypothetical protein [Sinorhizobium meliloti]AAK65234.2 hypothetical protein SMa1063 [Sinorhizobium meliloti 1021]AGG70258.1 Hypothetical protein SM2011_a1063 [Sinorhizobium meliloti 2011]ASP60350.1 hypothetical protein CDO30_18580 [Sinorhizobium meliloti]RVL37803.1 hypothetical protein CN146_31300 [Sinorhizobium meliloti]RVN07946.1 hypothetical protein CN115_23960 [Sinorhizobium meliloti]